VRVARPGAQAWCVRRHQGTRYTLSLWIKAQNGSALFGTATKKQPHLADLGGILPCAHDFLSFPPVRLSSCRSLPPSPSPGDGRTVLAGDACPRVPSRAMRACVRCVPSSCPHRACDACPRVRCALPAAAWLFGDERMRGVRAGSAILTCDAGVIPHRETFSTTI
jgi:hypothetical protein